MTITRYALARLLVLMAIRLLPPDDCAADRLWAVNSSLKMKLSDLRSRSRDR